MKRSRDDSNDGGFRGQSSSSFGLSRGRGGSFGGRGGSRGGHGHQAIVRIKGAPDGRDDIVPVENLYERKKAARAGAPSLGECWICGRTDHRRSDCPQLAEQNNIQKKLVCLGCRRVGHKLSECPDKGSSYVINQNHDGAAGTCFNCGASHRLRDCPEPRNGTSLPFAMCFVCNSKGHLAKDCPDNASKGVYPRGGSCKVCGDVRHFARDCPVEKERMGWTSSGGASSSEAPAASSKPSSAPASSRPVSGDDDDLGGNLAAPAAPKDDEDGGADYKNNKRAKKAGKHGKHA